MASPGVKQVLVTSTGVKAEAVSGAAIAVYNIYVDEEPDKANIVFISESSIIGVRTVSEGAISAIPVLPERPDDSFLGWFTKDNISLDQVIMNHASTEDILVYSRWQGYKLVPYHISYSENGWSYLYQLYKGGNQIILPDQNLDHARTDQNCLSIPLGLEDGYYSFDLKDTMGNHYGVNVDWKAPQTIEVKATVTDRTIEYLGGIWDIYEFDIELPNSEATFSLSYGNQAIAFRENGKYYLRLRHNELITESKHVLVINGINYLISIY